ncbi:hypothetical protein [Mesorhizobium temperatum]|uniref:HNH endonuclease 5 domain-containing protein n=1 Tax=Mesorhizobium temperatum TaxID=241416 RepID=A0A271LJ44_9HYPH|nr:hypothetical protein [Mesorhizobium temperatum]PAQ08133.1 hypothetical protein CIT26_19425 [Mesorhizobium temperatum]
MALPVVLDTCGLCGTIGHTTREHVVPKCLYPASKSKSRFQRITIAACEACNNGTADEDTHLRNVLLVAGDANDAVREIWESSFQPRMSGGDGRRRAKQLFDIMRPAPDAGANRHRIYPAEDPRIVKSIRKVIRGLSRHYGLHYPVSDGRVFADVLRQPVPLYLLDDMQQASAEPDILTYRYQIVTDTPGLLSAWLLTFYERTTFVGLVYADEESNPTTTGPSL